MEMCMSKLAEKRAESPGPEESTELAEPPQVLKVVKSRGGKRCLLTAFGDVAWTRDLFFLPMPMTEGHRDACPLCLYPF